MTTLNNYFDKFPLFEKLKMTNYDFHHKQRLYQAMQYRYFNQNDTIFNFGDIGDQFYIILKGKVSVRIPKQQSLNLTRYEFFKFILKNLQFIDLSDKDNLSIPDFRVISEELLQPHNMLLLSKLRSETAATFSMSYYTKYFSNDCLALKSYCSEKAKVNKR